MQRNKKNNNKKNNNKKRFIFGSYPFISIMIITIIADMCCTN